MKLEMPPENLDMNESPQISSESDDDMNADDLVQTWTESEEENESLKIEMDVEESPEEMTEDLLQKKKESERLIKLLEIKGEKFADAVTETKELLEELEGNRPFLGLRRYWKFLDNGNSKTSLNGIKNLLKLSPKCDAILNVLKNSTVNHLNAQLIFNILGNVLIGISTKLKGHESTSLHITKHILENHLELFTSPLFEETIYVKNVQATLHCLTGMVSCGSATAGLVLENVNFDEIKFAKWALSRSQELLIDLRTYLTFLIIAFLKVDDNNILSRFLSVKDFMSSIFRDMVNDPFKIASRMIKIIDDKIVLNDGIGRGDKLELFNFYNCMDLLNLYNWFDSKGGERVKIVQLMDKMMYVVFTDVNHGIVFEEDSKKINNHLLRILNHSLKLWKTSAGRELIAATVLSRPELLKSFNYSVKKYIKEPTPEIDFVTLIQLYAQIIERIDPSAGWSESSFNFDVKKLFPLPYSFMRDILLKDSFILKYVGTNVLIAYLRKVKQIENQVKIASNLTPFERNSICEAITKDIKDDEMLPLILMNNWDNFLKEDWIKDKWERANLPLSSNMFVFSASVEIITLYVELFNFNSFGASLSLVKMLDRVLRFKKYEKEEHFDCFLGMVRGILKLISCSSLDGIVDLNLTSLSVSSDDHLEKNLLYLLISTYATIGEFEGSNISHNAAITDIEDLCSVLLTNVLRMFGISDCRNDEPKLWINREQNDDRKHLNLFFTRTIIYTAKNLAKYLDKIIGLNKIKCESSKLGGVLLEDLDKYKAKDCEDNCAILDSTLGVSFSCLIAGASDLLKERAGEILYINYFSSIVDEYIHSVSDPGFLAYYLILEEVPLSQSMKSYVQSFYNISSGLEKTEFAEFPTDVKNSFEQLKRLFISRQEHDISTFDFDEEFADVDNILPFLRHIICYIKLESQWKLDIEKKRFYEYFVNVLSNALKKIFINEQNCRCIKLIKFLIEEPIILELYSPFSNNLTINESVNKLILMLFSNAELMKESAVPFINKIINGLQNTSDLDVDFWDSTCVYFETSALSYDNVESMLELCFHRTDFDNDSLIKLINVLLKLIIEYTNKYCHPSTEVAKLMFSKFLIFRLKAEYSETQNRVDSMMTLLGEALDKIVLCNVKLSLDEDDFKGLMECLPFCLPLCCSFVKTNPICIPIFSEKLNTMDLSLEVYGSLVTDLLTVDNITNINSCIEQLKEQLMSWCLDPKSLRNNGYESLLTRMLSLDQLKQAEVGSVCNFLVQYVVEEKNKPPLHVINILQSFNRFAMSDKCQIQALKICLMSIRKLYGRDEKIEIYGTGFLQEIVQMIQVLVKHNVRNLSEKKFAQNPVWMSFVKKVLRTAFTDKEVGALLIMCLTQLTDAVYNSSDVLDSADEGLSLAFFFEMVRSHSIFIDMMMTNDSDLFAVKEKIVLLLIVMVGKNPKLATEKDVPLLFAAYGATRSSCDQAILKLIMMYERNECMPFFSPILWGEAALNHFAVENPNAIDSVCVPRASQSFLLVDGAKVMETARKFDTSMTLEPTDIIGDDSSIYDQRFLLMLFIDWTDSDKYLEVMELIDKGCIAMAIAALTSQNEDVWLAGATLLKNMTDLFQNTRHVNLKQLWLWLTYVFCYAMNGKRTIISSITSSFLIEAVQIMNKPDCLLHWPIVKHIYAKPSMDFTKVPELYQLYFSESLTANFEERLFLLQYLSSGIRSEIDLNLAIKSHLPRMVFALLSSPLSSSKLKIEALNVIKSLVAIPRGSCVLALDHGLVSQLSTSIQTFEWSTNAQISLITTFEIVQITFKNVLKSFRETNMSSVDKETKKKSVGGKKESKSNGDKENKTLRSKKGKRKLSENDETIKISKKQKLETNKGEDIQCLKKFLMGNIESFLTEILFFVGRAFPLFIEFVPRTSLISFFEFIIEITEETSCFSTSRISTKGKSNVGTYHDVVCKQVGEWINKEAILSRLSDKLTEYDQFLLSDASGSYEEKKIMFAKRSTDDSTDDLLKVTRILVEKLNKKSLR